MASRTSVTSENITVAPARTSKIGGEAERGIGGDAGKRVAAAALQADHEIGGRAGFALALVEHGEPRIGHAP